MQRYKNFNSTGIALDGRLYAGDLNAIMDAAAALSDFAQTVDVSTLRIGDTGIQLSKFGTSEAQFSGHLRALGILRGLGGMIAGAFTTTQRNAIASGFAPYGMIILNTTTNQYEWNHGTDAARDWRGLGIDPALSLTFLGATSAIHFTNQDALNTIMDAQRTADTVTRFMLREDGRIEWGAGAGARDAKLYRDAANRLRLDNELNLGGYKIYFGNLGASMMVDGVDSYIRGGTLSIQNADGSAEYGFIGNDNYEFPDGRFAIRGVPTKPFIQSGSLTIVTAGSTVHVTFAVPFAAAPVVLTDRVGPSGIGHSSNITATGFDFTGGTGSNTVYEWLAIGTL